MTENILDTKYRASIQMYGYYKALLFCWFKKM